MDDSLGMDSLTSSQSSQPLFTVQSQSQPQSQPFNINLSTGQSPVNPVPPPSSHFGLIIGIIVVVALLIVIGFILYRIIIDIIEGSLRLSPSPSPSPAPVNSPSPSPSPPPAPVNPTPPPPPAPVKPTPTPPPAPVNPTPPPPPTPTPPPPPPHSPPPVDCVVTWGEWSNCSHVCGTDGTQQRVGTITTQPQNGGKTCPSPLTQTMKCNPQPPACDSQCCGGVGIQSSTMPINRSTSESPAISPTPSSECKFNCICNPGSVGQTCQNKTSASVTVPGWT